MSKAKVKAAPVECEVAEVEIPQVVIDRATAQLDYEDELEVGERINELREAKDLIHAKSLSLARSMERPNNLIDRKLVQSRLENIIESAQRGLKALRALPLIALVLIFIGGCNGDRHGEEPAQMERVNTCEGGKCEYPQKH